MVRVVIGCYELDHLGAASKKFLGLGGVLLLEMFLVGVSPTLTKNSLLRLPLFVKEIFSHAATTTVKRFQVKESLKLSGGDGRMRFGSKGVNRGQDGTKDH